MAIRRFGAHRIRAAARLRQAMRRTIRRRRIRHSAAGYIQNRWRNIHPEIREHRYMMRLAELSPRGERYRSRAYPNGIPLPIAENIADYAASSIGDARLIRNRAIRLARVRAERRSIARRRVGQAVLSQLVRQNPRALNYDLIDNVADYLG